MYALAVSTLIKIIDQNKDQRKHDTTVIVLPCKPSSASYINPLEADIFLHPVALSTRGFDAMLQENLLSR